MPRVTLRQSGNGPLNFEHLQRARSLLSQPTSELKKWIFVAASTLSENSTLALKEWVNLPDTTRACVASSVGSVLAPWTREPLSRLVIPDGNRPTLDLRQVIDSGSVVVINVAHTENAEELWPACLLLKQALFKLALSRSRLPINQDRMVAVVIDEATRLLSGHNHLSSEHIALEMARSNKVAFILAAQNLSALNAVNGEALTDKLAALCGNQFFLANNCPATLRLAQRCFGNKIVKRRHETRASALPPPQIFPGDHPHRSVVDQVTFVPTEVPVISAETLARLPTGAVWAKLVDGSVHKFQCTFD